MIFILMACGNKSRNKSMEEKEIKVNQPTSTVMKNIERRKKSPTQIKIEEEYKQAEEYRKLYKKLSKSIPLEERIANNIDPKRSIIDDRYKLENNVFLPVYKFSENLIGIAYENPQMNDSIFQKFMTGEIQRAYYEPINIDNVLTTIEFKKNRLGNLIRHREIDSTRMVGNEKLILYIYGTNGNTTAMIKEFLFHLDECNLYEIYRLTEIDSSIGNPILASIKPIELMLPENNDEINRLKQITAYGGCCGKDNKDKLFKRIMNTDLYIFSDDSYPLNGKVDYPSRSVLWNSNDTIMTPLWISSLDFFGDSCL